MYKDFTWFGCNYMQGLDVSSVSAVKIENTESDPVEKHIQRGKKSDFIDLLTVFGNLQYIYLDNENPYHEKDSSKFNYSKEAAIKLVFEDTTKKLDLISQPTIKRIKDFSRLEHNWDSYDAEPISWLTISKAIDFFTRVIKDYQDAPLPFVAPTPNGSIHFEWEKCSTELRHLIPKDESNVYIYKIIDKSSGVLKQTTNKVNGIDNMLDVFSNWMDPSLTNENRTNTRYSFSLQESL